MAERPKDLVYALGEKSPFLQLRANCSRHWPLSTLD